VGTVAIATGRTVGLGEFGQRNKDCLAIFLLATVLFVFALSPEFVGFQCRFAVFAKEMLHYGPSYFPTIYRRAYPDYPATGIFLIYLASVPFGRVTPFSAVLPTAIASALVLMLTYRIGAMRSRRLGLAAALLAISTLEFLDMSRNIALDQYTSLATVLSFYVVSSASHYGRRARLWSLPLIWALGFAFRGPIGLVVPAAGVAGYYLWNRRFRYLIVSMIAAGAVLAVGIVTLVAAAKAQGGASLAKEVLDAQMASRLNDRGPGLAFYWLRCFLSYAPSYPLAFLLVLSRWRDMLHRKTEDDNWLAGLTVWVLVVLIGMSIPSVKHTRYVLPIVPAISLMGAHLLLTPSDKPILKATRKLSLQLCRMFPWVAAGGVVVVLLSNWAMGLQWTAHYVISLVLLVPLGLVGRKMESDQGPGSLALLAAICCVVTIGIANPIYYSTEKTGPFVRRVEVLRQANPGDIVFFKIGPDQEDIKFVANLPKPIIPRFVESADELSQLRTRSCIIMRPRVFQTLSLDDSRLAEPVVRGKIGHVEVVALIWPN
jgi:4-amino-4-deoxy-L-arabinose transferase-like glycosyltransferase